MEDHATIRCWVYKFSPFSETQIKKRKKAIGKSCRSDETDIKEKGI